MDAHYTQYPGINRTDDGRNILSPELVARSVHSAILECATTLRADYYNCILQNIKDADPSDTSLQQTVLKQIDENSWIGKNRHMPICQDTGSVWICLEVGDEVLVPGNVFSGVPNAVRDAYVEGRLRLSMVKDAVFDRTNTGDNNPAFTEIKTVPGRSCRIHLMLKGGGSDNASRLVMLNPSDGREGIKRELLECVRQKAANACPPLLIGVGIGATFDKVGGLSKQALLREVGSPAESAEAAEFEDELLEAVNATGIGPAALGGTLTAVAVHIKTAPCHIAALPLAINMGCCAMRSSTRLLIDEDGNVLDDPAADTWLDDRESR